MEHNAEYLVNASLGDKLEVVIKDLPATEVTLVEILDSIGYDSLLFVTIFLSLVFLVPVSIPGVSTVFGSAILLIGISRLIGRKLWVPKWIANRTISSEKLTVVLNRALKFFRKLEKFSRPYQFRSITSDGKAGLFNKLAYVFAAVLLMVPFGFVPFSNTLPALALIFLSVGEMQKDGRCVFIGHLANLVTVIYFSALVAGGGMTIYEIVRLASGT